MPRVSDDESSDSSDDFLVPADKIDFSNSFFKKKPEEKPTGTVNTKQPEKNEKSENESEEDENASTYVDVFSNILSNLEAKREKNDELKKEAKETNQDVKNEINENEIRALLLQGEAASSAINDSVNEEQHDEDEEKPSVSTDYNIPKEGVQVTLPGSEMVFRKKKCGTDMAEVLRTRINRRIRENQEIVHRVGLLCWLTYGFHLNNLANNPELMSVTLPLVPKSSYPKGRLDLTYLEKFTKWFKKLFTIEKDSKENNTTVQILLQRVKEKRIDNYKELVLLYISTLRAIGINCRLVVSLCPPRQKPAKDQLFPTPNEQQKKNGEEKPDKVTIKKNTNKSNNERPSKQVKKKSSKENTEKKEVPQNSPEGKQNARLEARKRAAALLQSKAEKEKSNKECSNETAKQSNDKSIKTEENNRITGLRKLRSSTKPTISITENSKKSVKEEKVVKEEKSLLRNNRNMRSTRKKSFSDFEEESEDENDSEHERPTRTRRGRSAVTEKNAIKKSNVQVKRRTTSKKVKKEKEVDSDFIKSSEAESSEDSDKEVFTKQSFKRKSTSCGILPSNKSVKTTKLISSDEEDYKPTKDSRDIWIEVYVESEESWISVSVIDEKIHCVQEIYKKATNPVLYIIAYNSVGKVKDVTRRYCPQWLTITRKKRVDEKWWSVALTPWKEPDNAISKAEDEMLLQKELEQPLPKTVGECKGHPLYALARHLLKYEALYPKDCVPLGYLPNGEAIYSRHCVHTLYSRETWVKRARVVKPAQEAYKIVKAMPKYDKLSGVKLKDQPLELFGEWQTTEYEPPEAKDGIVPRNEYGNVDLFKECMLPKGCVHIKLPGLNRIARKLNIDCSPAVVGFNFGQTGALPAFDGFVVCVEYEDTLREAWEEEQVQAAKRAKEKREKRIFGNWRKLIRGLSIRERLASRYNFNKDDEEYEDDEKPSMSRKRAKKPTTGGVFKKIKKS